MFMCAIAVLLWTYGKHSRDSWHTFCRCKVCVLASTFLPDWFICLLLDRRRSLPFCRTLCNECPPESPLKKCTVFLMCRHTALFYCPVLFSHFLYCVKYFLIMHCSIPQSSICDSFVQTMPFIPYEAAAEKPVCLLFKHPVSFSNITDVRAHFCPLFSLCKTFFCTNCVKLLVSCFVVVFSSFQIYILCNNWQLCISFLYSSTSFHFFKKKSFFPLILSFIFRQLYHGSSAHSLSLHFFTVMMHSARLRWMCS